MSSYYPEGCTQSTIDRYFGMGGGGYLSIEESRDLIDENDKIMRRIEALDARNDLTPEEEEEIYTLSMALEENEEELRKDDEFDAEEDALYQRSDAQLNEWLGK